MSDETKKSSRGGADSRMARLLASGGVCEAATADYRRLFAEASYRRILARLDRLGQRMEERAALESATDAS